MKRLVTLLLASVCICFVSPMAVAMSSIDDVISTELLSDFYYAGNDLDLVKIKTPTKPTDRATNIPTLGLDVASLTVPEQDSIELPQCVINFAQLAYPDLDPSVLSYYELRSLDMLYSWVYLFNCAQLSEDGIERSPVSLGVYSFLSRSTMLPLSTQSRMEFPEDALQRIVDSNEYFSSYATSIDSWTLDAIRIVSNGDTDGYYALNTYYNDLQALFVLDEVPTILVQEDATQLDEAVEEHNEDKKEVSQTSTTLDEQIAKNEVNSIGASLVSDSTLFNRLGWRDILFIISCFTCVILVITALISEQIRRRHDPTNLYKRK